MIVTTPVRVSHTGRQVINGSPDGIFPLYCPVRELEWVPDWSPRFVTSASGVAEHECVFITGEPDQEAIWVVTRHDPKNHGLEMIKVTPGVTVCRLEIHLEPLSEQRTRAVITYTHTSLGPAGDDFVAGFTQDHYSEFMANWARAMNHFLETGRCLDRTAGGDDG